MYCEEILKKLRWNTGKQKFVFHKFLVKFWNTEKFCNSFLENLGEILQKCKNIYVRILVWIVTFKFLQHPSNPYSWQHWVHGL